MRLTRHLFPAALVLAVAGPAAAQATTHGTGHGTAHGTDHGAAAAAQPAEWSGDLPAHFEGIALTDAQKQQVAALQKEYHARMDAMRDSARAAGAGADAPALRAQIQRVMAEEHAAFRALLDEAGRKRFDENMARMHAGRHGAAPAAHDSAAHGAAAHGAHGAHGGRPPASHR
jgi:hypothetical protein